jgi:hypothetical protein
MNHEQQKELIATLQLTRRLRKMQKFYFSSRIKSALQESKQLEKELDEQLLSLARRGLLPPDHESMKPH